MIPADLPPELYLEEAPLTYSCLVKAADHHNVPIKLMAAILVAEGGKVGQASKPNDNKTYDIGPFQINSSWLDDLSASGISETRLTHNGCVNAYVGAWRLSEEIKTSKDLVAALGNYHSRTPKYHFRYLKRMLPILKKSIRSNLISGLTKANARYLGNYQ